MKLQCGDWQALICPEQGAAFASLQWRGRDVLVPAPEGARHPGAYGAFWMLPWANRLDAGRIAGHVLPINRAAEGTAIHGLARDLPWEVISAAPDHALLQQRLNVAPFDYTAQLAVTLDAQGLVMEMTLRHEGAAPAPYGMGWHPWFMRSAATSLHLNATQRAHHTARGLPESVIPCVGITAHEAGLIGLDNFFAGWDGSARLTTPAGTITLSATGDFAAGVQVYAPPAQPILCVEPVSHMPDAPNRPALAAAAPMRVLARGQALHGTIRLTAA
ncbi:MAG: aldose epimerase [Roseomonas sp.]|nr:aldose epimerase [Roseomonas sp.]MCA3326858.1 aldose epimerase [Roseomonas sp.]MCA3331731.1 aldose epimerase [Roseomonas sp.]MCA3333308.1 aldose epimerase [Roseomonas sp.]MCA3347968.1 aldose epimerase [Roseomonas sp.]